MFNAIETDYEKGLRKPEAFSLEDMLDNYGPFLGVVRAHYMVLCFGFLRRKARRLGGNWCKFAQPRPLSGLRYSPTEGSPFTLCDGPFLSMPPNPPKSQSEAYSSK